MLDFNDSDVSLSPVTSDTRREEIRAALLARLESVLFTLFPAGKVRKGTFYIGDILGSPGDSLEIVLTGEKAGLWTDRCGGDGGDIYSVIAGHHGLDVRSDFPRVLEISADLVGRTASMPARSTRKTKQEASTDDLGKATAKWDYLDASGSLIAVVYRYDPPGRRKEFRPWDAKRRKMAPPDPRPLYNQQGIAQSEQVVLVEGEKCAQALIDAGYCATTAMHGANAPVDKTDWSPLASKHVLIWPDRDKPGWEYADRASHAILDVGAASVAILYPPAEKPEGWDVADAIAETFDVRGFLLTGDRVPIAAQSDAPIDDDLVEGIDWTTEDGLATAFTRRFGEDWRFCAQWGKWLVWTGIRWNPDQLLYVQHLSRNVCRAASFKADTSRLRTRLASSSTISAVERIARSDPKHASMAEHWDADVWLLNTPGGVVNLRTGVIRPHDRADRMTKVCTAVAHGDCPTWRGFLSDVTGGDAELTVYLQRMVGYCLTGVTSEHALFFLYGTGANGKSVFVNVIATILGDYAANAPMDTFMETRSDRHPTDLAGLRGARFVAAIETEQGRRWNESKIKTITGGDKVSARFMRQDFFDYTPHFKLVIAGNHKPSIRNVDEAMKRRLHLVPFTVTIPPERRDGKLTEKLLQERDGILAWALQGCLLWQQQGLKQPQSVLTATEEYFESEDSMGRWIEERCTTGSAGASLTADLFADWKQWAETAGEFVGTQKRLSELLQSRGFAKWRNTGGLRGLQGIGLKFRVEPRSYPHSDHN